MILTVWIRGLLACLGLACLASAAAQEPPASEGKLEAMVKRASLLKMSYADDPDRAAPELLRAPVLRASDPTRDEIDGAVWLWLDGKRPVAGLCLLLYPNGKWNYEHIALADEALAVTGRPAWSWQPKAAARNWRKLADPVPASARAQQSALRSIARRVAASETRRGETFALRLLDRPIYTYADEEHGLVSGGFFAMSYGTNPELLVQLEARQDGDTAHWHLAFARMSAAAITVRLDEKELWTAEAMKADDPSGSYFGVNELPGEE